MADPMKAIQELMESGLLGTIEQPDLVEGEIEEQTVLDQAWAEHKGNAAVYAEEMRELEEAGADYSGNEGWKNLMSKVGRR